jgi:hypothetical protein
VGAGLDAAAMVAMVNNIFFHLKKNSFSFFLFLSLSRSQKRIRSGAVAGAGARADDQRLRVRRWKRVWMRPPEW